VDDQQCRIACGAQQTLGSGQRRNGPADAPIESIRIPTRLAEVALEVDQEQRAILATGLG
jgi:hypothetical protein